MAELKKVKAVQDDDGHWYVIPEELGAKFSEMLGSAHEDDYEEFAGIFEEYRTGGDLNLVQLFADI